LGRVLLDWGGTLHAFCGASADGIGRCS
jgi:hypothetical protein